MSAVLKAIAQQACRHPHRIAMEGDQFSLSYATLQAEVESLAQQFKTFGYQRMGMMLDNGPAWAVVDLAAMAAGITLIPIPSFFTPQQIKHTLIDAGIEVVISHQCRQLNELAPTAKIQPIPRIAGQNAWLTWLPKKQPEKKLNNIAKITYTSGTTAAPKGVCLTQKAMDQVATSLCDAIKVTSNDRHLCLLPLAVLLENIGGLYAPLIAGATSVIPSLANVGMLGASGINPQKIVQAISDSHASTIILLPQMLQALVEMVDSGIALPKSLRFIAVGGAPVSNRLLTRAAALGLPVYEGYGLSECASVVAVNTPHQQRNGSVGKLLPHIQLRFAEDGEILLRGDLFNGYLNGLQHNAEEWYPSGDLGHQDNDGYLYLTGRKKNCFITGFGRNVAPEWVERELTLSPHIAQAVVFGEAQPFNVAIITPRGNASADEIQLAINEANSHLPDYARVSNWLTSDEPFSVANQLFTATGRPRRNAIWDYYASPIKDLYRVGPIKTQFISALLAQKEQNRQQTAR